MNFILFVINTVFSLLSILLLLRAWMQLSRVDFYNPLSQFVVRITQPVIGPLRRIIPSIGALDTASVLSAYLLVLCKIVLIFFLAEQAINISPLTFAISLIVLIKTIGKMIFWVLLLRAVLSWISQGQSPMEFILSQLSEPLLAPIRRILPNTGGLDFSVMVAMFILFGLNYLGGDLSNMFGMYAYWMNL